jgi:deoxycytidine triphosphate deaminase
VYVSDHELRGLLGEMDLGGADDGAAAAFDPDTQIQPCSIDLRISNVFWKPSRRRRIVRRLGRRVGSVDLRHAGAHDLEPLRDWKQYVLEDGETLTIKPGGILMGRIHERFRIPPAYAGKIEGRSSFARLGLSVHCTGDFINPGWHGFMPLQLYNAGPYPIRVTPYLMVCQLMLIRLVSEPEQTYGDPGLQSKYVNDDGGPSKWWRDRSVLDLQKRLGEVHISGTLQVEILERVRFVDPEVLERLRDYVTHLQIGQIENRQALLENFARLEDRRRLADRVAIAAVPVLAAAVLASLFALPIGIGHIVLYVLTVVAIFFGFRGYLRQDSGYLGHNELKQADPVRQGGDHDARAS